MSIFWEEPKETLFEKLRKQRIESGMEFSENSPFKKIDVIRYPVLEEEFSEVKIKEE